MPIAKTSDQEKRNHLEAENRYAKICRKSLENDPEYYQPQLDRTLQIIERLTIELEGYERS